MNKIEVASIKFLEPIADSIGILDLTLNSAIDVLYKSYEPSYSFSQLLIDIDTKCRPYTIFQKKSRKSFKPALAKEKKMKIASKSIKKVSERKVRALILRGNL